MILGIAAALSTLLLWSVGTMAFLTASRAINPALLNRTRLALAVVATGILACILTPFWPWQLITGATPVQWLWLGLSGIVGLTIGDFLGFSGLRILGARRQSVISTIAPAAAAAAGFIALDERISWIGIGGMILSIAGIMYSLSGTEERSDVDRDGYGSFTAGVLYTIGGAVCQGVGLVLAKLGLEEQPLSPFHATFLRMSIGFASTYLLDMLRRTRIHPMRTAFADRQGARSMLIGAVFGPIIGVTCSLIAVKHLEAGIAQTIFSLIPFVVMTIAAVRYRERLRPQVIIGAIIAVAGVILLVQG